MEKAKKKSPLHCPACESPLRVSRLFCRACETEVAGSFDLPLFLRLNQKEQNFIMEFIKSSGSLKDMAKEMGISYPTVRNLLDDLIEKIKLLEKGGGHE